MVIRRTIFVLLMFYAKIVSSQDVYEESTVQIVTVETTTQEVIIITDISEAEVEDALKIESGDYTTTIFEYINFQFASPRPHEDCYDNFIKCKITIGISMPVCAGADPYRFRVFDDECSVHFDNCRRSKRRWWILEYGRCILYRDEIVDIDTTRRRWKSRDDTWNFMLKLLGKNGNKHRETNF